ncbi:MAG TPA: DUF3175 domain-containing protein [Bradyrhizobium sp.]
MELIMAEHRKTAPSRKAATLKSPRKNTRKPATRKTSTTRRKASPELTSYINRAGKTLPKTQRERLQRAKTELKRQFNRE